MIEVNQKAFAVVIALAMSAILMIVGSFIAWANNENLGSKEHYNWKWMCVFTLFIVAVLMMARG